MITVLALVSFLNFLAYLCYYFRYYREVPPSLSETFYIIDHPYLFTMSMFCMLITIVAPMVEITPDKLRSLAFLCPVGIGFVGAAPLFKEEFDGVVHTAGAIVAAAAGLLWVIFATEFWWVILFVSVIVAIVAASDESLFLCHTFWLEMICFFSVYIALLLSLLL